ncbi:hypothetical protein [Mycolicibacterium fluoranthenivorans]|uniref:Uncharacterized protein n=1 Tax=Mycolicibacterium fluoranthenivorans TaxID=258505 RepID=A0A1G4W1L0_9MYCO|nr:hypothetical protein [Mycolicibacterium fluoranthenivorans]SCX15277.1 hypothetical protein SAMN02799620_02028 [Mycolicibacterium fluoranthenivorans]
MTQPQYGQKLVSATDVRGGDRIFRKTKEGVELMMLVDDLGFKTTQTEHTLSYTGLATRLNPSRVGGRMSGTDIGVQTWTIPANGKVTKVVPIAEAEFR